MQSPKISICIVCMGRLHQLRKTLLKNIEDSLEYENTEFILLDYNSTDGLNEWARKHLQPFINSGKLIYFRTPDPEIFSHSHAKNMAFRLASGEIICNLNADHYLGSGFINYVNQTFSKEADIVITPVDYFKTRLRYGALKDLFGKVCVLKSSFLAVTGFDERMDGYGFEDWDFVNRLEIFGVRRILLEGDEFMKFISHDDNLRHSLEAKNRQIEKIYVSYISPSRSMLLILYHDRRFEHGTLIDHTTEGSEDIRYAWEHRQYRFENSVEGNSWSGGTWANEGNTLILAHKKGKNECLLPGKCGTVFLNERGAAYQLLKNEESIQSVIKFRKFYHNRSLMEANLENKVVAVNVKGFGRGRVFRNFQLKEIFL